MSILPPTYGAQYQPDRKRDERNRMIKLLSEAIKNRPIAIVISSEQAQEIINHLAGENK